MKTIRHAIMLFLVCMAASGCESMTHSAYYQPLYGKGPYWMQYNANRRGALVSVGKNGFKMLAEPPPDAATSALFNLVGKVDFKSQTAEGSAQITQNVSEFAKRSQTILFLRESLYRLGELTTNGAITPAEASGHYDKVVEVAKQIALAEVAAAHAREVGEQANLTNAQAALRRARSEQARVIAAEYRVEQDASRKAELGELFNKVVGESMARELGVEKPDEGEKKPPAE